METEIGRLKEWIAGSGNIVFFGGAGVSTESGIPDFRSVDGLYRQSYRYPPETILSRSFFERCPEEFYRFYREKLTVHGAKPNAAHRRLAQLEAEGRLRAVITQNIDGLHQDAGSRKVLELHGSVRRCRCARCGRRCPPRQLEEAEEALPRCSCGGLLRPDIVLYEEALDEKVLEEAAEHIRAAEMLIVGGTSLAVYPAAGLLRFYRGHKLALVNLSPTPRDGEADLLIRERIGRVFSQV